MRQAPPVGVTCTGRGAWRWVQVLLPALAAGIFMFWAMARLQQSPLWAGPAAVVAGVAVLRRPRPVSLQWDGQAWQADGHAGDVAVMIDLDRWLLLRWRADGASRWLALGRTEAGPAWHGLRAALYAS